MKKIDKAIVGSMSAKQELAMKIVGVIAAFVVGKFAEKTYVNVLETVRQGK